MTPVEILQKYWGYDSFRPLQSEIIDSLLAGHDTIGLLPTGGGKSITFQVPALMSGGLTIVVTPLVSLMKDQVDNLYNRGIKAVWFHSGQTRHEATLSLDRCRLGKVCLAYLSPERLMQKAFVDELAGWNVSNIVVDEAHCISQWGYDFRPSYLRICELRKIFPDAPVLALTASATPEVVADIAVRLQMRDHRVFTGSFARDNISYIVRHDEDKPGRLLKVLSTTAGSSIVYVRSRRRTRELATLINEAGISADYYHAGLTPEEKSDRQDRWKNDEIRVIVATNAFGMGIDKPDVRVVVHYDMPSSLEEYYQEAGRAGRDSRHSYAVMLVSKHDKAILSRRLTDSFPSKEFICRTYELLGNYLDVIVGGGYNKVYDCDFDRFCLTFRLNPSMTRSALGILTRSGYIEYSDESLTRARIMVVVDKSDFYNLDLTPAVEKVFQTVLRLYPGLFADYVAISESRVATLAGVGERDVTEALIALSKMHVISYIPRRLTPYVFYPTSREEPRYLVIPRTVYEDQRQRMSDRLDAMKHYAYSEDECRAKIILRYFGQTDAGDCGHCDVCRLRRKNSLSVSAVDDMRASIESKLRVYGKVTVESLVASFGPQRKAAVELVRSMAEEGILIIDGLTVSLA